MYETAFRSTQASCNCSSTFQGHFDAVKKKGRNDHLVDRGGQKKIHRAKVQQKDDYFEYWEQSQPMDNLAE